MDLQGKKILIFQQRKWAKNIGHFLARKLQAEGCELAALTLKRTTHSNTTTQQEVKYSLIINNDEIMSDPKSYLQNDDFSLEEICSELGVDTIWPIVMSLRNHVRSYQDKYYYGYKQNVSDEDIVCYVKALYKCILKIFNDFKPDLIIAPNFVSLPHIMFNLYAGKHGVKMLGITDSKVRGYNIFVTDYKSSTGAFYDRVDELNRNNILHSLSSGKARQYIIDSRKKLKIPDYFEKFVSEKEKGTNFWQRIKKELAPYYHIYCWYFQKNTRMNFLKSTGVTIDYRPPKIILRDHYSRKKYQKFMDNFKYYPFDKLNKFVYFPLQFQPEASIDVMAPFFSNQIEVARLVAMSLPNGYVLAVKEHPAMIGLRTPSYIEKIDRTPNVKLIDYRISSEKVLERADLIISPNSTSLAEAAFLRKPAIQLGDLGTTLKLPNVFKHSDMTTLTKKIKEVLEFNLHTKEYENKLENFVAAVFDTGFNVNYMSIWEKGDKEKIENIWQAYKRELERRFK